MTFGNYDAGKFSPISNPFKGGVRKADAGKTEFNFDFGFTKAGNVDGVKNPLGITRTTVTPETRIAEHR